MSYARQTEPVGRDVIEAERERAAARRTRETMDRRGERVLEVVGWRATEDEVRAHLQGEYPGWSEEGIEGHVRHIQAMQERARKEEERVSQENQNGTRAPRNRLQIETAKRRKEWARDYVRRHPTATAEEAHAALPEELADTTLGSFRRVWTQARQAEGVTHTGRKPKKAGAKKRSEAKKAPTAPTEASGGHPLANGGDPELTAMHAAVKALEGLDEPVAARVVGYLYDRYGRCE